MGTKHSWSFLGVLGVIVAYGSAAVAVAGEEVVVPGESAPPPAGIAEPAMEGGENDYFLASTQSCYGQNNRSSGNTARGDSASTIDQIYKFKIGNQTFWRKVQRRGDSIRSGLSPAFYCSRVPAVVPGGLSDGSSCVYNESGRVACDYGSGSVTYRCTGAQHQTADFPTDMTCSINSESVSCASHANGATHQCSLFSGPQRFVSYKYWAIRYSPAQLVCTHRQNLDFTASTTIYQSSDGVSWSKDSGATVAYSSNERFVVKVPLSGTNGAKIDELQAMAYRQNVAANSSVCGYYGCNGDLTHRQLPPAVKTKAIDVSVQFAGSDGFCGGFHSPLMLFFQGERMPRFSGTSKFQMGTKGSKYSWPEAGSQGHLLALDLRGDRKITGEAQLFGENSESSNGFLALAAHDANKDGRIDREDPVFDRLLLWNDKNGDGVSQKSEVRSVGEAGVESISLQYGEPGDVDLGDRAKLKQRGKFTYRKKGSKQLEEGTVFDVWFAKLN